MSRESRDYDRFMGYDEPPPSEDVVEDGQAECHKCGEWYRVTAPFIPHRCAPSPDPEKDDR